MTHSFPTRRSSDLALPVGQNSPQRPAFGLYTEQLSGTAFTAPRHENRRSWLYRMRPTAEHPPYTRYEGAERFAPGTVDQPLAPNRLRWDPLPLPQAPVEIGRASCRGRVCQYV